MVVSITLAESIQLVPDGTLFLHIAIIIVMVFILNRALFKPINRILSERDRHTRGSSADAQAILRRIDKSLEDYERTMREARTDSYIMLETRRSEDVLGRQQTLSSVREEIEHLVNKEKSDVREQASGARMELDIEAQRVASTIRRQILGR